MVAVICGPAGFYANFLSLEEASWVEYTTLLDGLALRFTSKITIPGEVMLNPDMISDIYPLSSKPPKK